MKEGDRKRDRGKERRCGWMDKVLEERVVEGKLRMMDRMGWQRRNERERQMETKLGRQIWMDRNG